MADMAKHATESTPPAGKSRADVWFVLIITGVTSAVLQMWHATHSGGTVLLIAALVGLVPAATAIGLSHVVASHKSAVALRVVTFAVMVAAMAASISAIAAVVEPIDGPYFSWVFGLALDAAALACVWVLLGDKERKAAEASALETAEDVARQAVAEAREAAEKAASLEVELASARTELTAVNAALEALRSDRKPRRSSARKPARSSARNQAPASAPEPAIIPAGSSAPEDVPDLDAEARILALIDQGHSASQAGILAGKSDSYGRQVARLARAAKTEPAGGERSDGDVN